MKRSAGFTVVEMMIAVAILGILLAIGMPSFATFIRNSQVRTAAENMQAGLNLARSEALRRNAPVSFWMVTNLTSGCALSSSGNSWVVSMANPAGKCQIASSETVAPRTIQTRSGNDATGPVTLSATGGGAARNCVTFNGFGQVEDTCTGGGTPIAKVEFNTATAGTKSLEVRITSGGAVRMCNPAMANTDDPTYCGA